MKKIKYIIVAVMAVILCLMCLMTTTFSWFTRPSQSGGILVWNNTDTGLTYEASDGESVSMATYELSEDGQSSSTTEVTGFSNTSGIEAGHRKYYRTDITNSGDSAQSVSLYMSGLKVTQGNLHLGVNIPLKTYKKYNTSASISSTEAQSGTMRVYLQPDKKTSWYDSGKNFEVWYSTDSNATPTVGVGMTYIKYDSTGVSNVYYADIPSNAALINFRIKGKSGDDNQTKNIVVSDEGLTPTQSKVFCLTGETDPDNWNNAKYNSYNVNGANIIRYYNTITMSVEGVFDAALASGVDYIGSGGISYSYEGSAISVSSSSIKANSIGTATFTTTVTGGTYGDTVQKNTTVYITEVVASDIPIVTNYEIPAAAEDGTPTVMSVYWYINNEEGASSALTYTIDEVYLSL